MSGNDIRTYFTKNAPPIPRVTTRAINALIRGGIETMDELLAKSDHELEYVRDLGEKSLAVAVEMREKYAKENKTFMEDTL